MSPCGSLSPGGTRVFLMPLVATLFSLAFPLGKEVLCKCNASHITE